MPCSVGRLIIGIGLDGESFDNEQTGGLAKLASHPFFENR